MKDKITNIVDSLFIFLLVISSIHCLTSSFDIAINSAVVNICAAMFTAVFALIATFAVSTSKYAISICTILLVFVVTIIFSYDTISAQLNYAVNSVLESYSQFLPVAGKVRFADWIDNNATAFFVALSALLCGLITFFIIRLRLIFPAAAISVVVIVPCFILINTLPDLLPLLTTFAVLFTLFVSSAIHRINTPHSGAVSSVVAVFMAILITVVYILNPVEGYERSKWQDNLLSFSQQITGFKSYDGKDIVSSSIKNIKKEVYLSDAGPVEKTNQKVMTVNSPYSGKLYLKGVAYVNYDNNTWSILTDEQAESYPKDFESATMTKSQNVPRATMNIITETESDVIYTPYFLSTVPASGTDVCDILITNDSKTKNYDVYFQTYIESEQSQTPLLITEDESVFFFFFTSSPDYSYYYLNNNSALAYKEFVYDNYLSVPESTKAEMIKYAEERGFADFSGDFLVDAVKEYVSNSASYSIKTEKVPQGKDISLWLLNESDTGYCVHFATSAAVMLRSLGIPARYVTGYCIEADSENSTIVSSDNAHAWVEYFDDNIGWVPLDATPPDFSVPVYSDTLQSSATTQPAESSTVQPTSQPTSQPTTTKPSEKPVVKDAEEITPVTVIIAVFSALIFAILSLLLRHKLTLLSRKKKFSSGKPNERAKYIYRYIYRLSKHSHLVVPEEIEDIVEKARFSTSRINQKELDIITRFAKSRERALIKDSPFIKKLYLRYILALI